MTLVQRIGDLAAAVRDKLNTMTPRLLPAGGVAGQALVKTAATDFATGWATVSGGIGAGDLPVRYDAAQPQVDCLWVSPTGQVVLITGS